jgi:NAD(P)-dependent dehydrogenase (short-subunit alcohol dehydrogenase family)
MIEKQHKRTVLITGTSSGLGQSCVNCFSAAGWNVIATMRRSLEEHEWSSCDNVLVAELDVTNAHTISAAIEAGIARFGNIDAVVNNAGHGLSGIFEITSPEAIQYQFEVNLFGPMRVIRAVLPHFRNIGKGLIINITSPAGVFGIPATSIYTSSKFALEGFSESLSYELLSQNIVVKIVEPGGMSGTSFHDNSLLLSEAWPTEGGYSDFSVKARKMFAFMSARQYPGPEAVAAVILEAATDGSDRLRYVAGEDVRPLIYLRRCTSEDRFMTHMRATLPGRPRTGG